MKGRPGKMVSLQLLIQGNVGENEERNVYQALQWKQLAGIISE